MTLFIALAVLTLLIVIYVAGGRTWLQRQPWAAGFFRWIEPIEIKCWRKSETLLWARFLQALGLVLTALSSLGQFDLSPIMPFLPDRYRWVPSMLPLIISMAGSLNEQLRKATTKPLELVELPDALPPAVAAAVATADATKEMAVEAVKTDTEEKKVSGLA